MFGYRVLAEFGHLAQHRPATSGGVAAAAAGDPGQRLQPGDVVLVKASNAAGLGALAGSLVADTGISDQGRGTLR